MNSFQSKVTSPLSFEIQGIPIPPFEPSYTKRHTESDSVRRSYMYRRRLLLVSFLYAHADFNSSNAFFKAFRNN